MWFLLLDNVYRMSNFLPQIYVESPLAFQYAWGPGYYTIHLDHTSFSEIKFNDNVHTISIL